MTRTTIGIHVYEGPDRLRATVRSVKDHTTGPVELLLLSDGADECTRAAIDSFDDLPNLTCSNPQGAAAAFNRLAAHDDADVVVLLESGCKVAPGWLEPLLAALDDPTIGLAGPSTNTCWNEQGRYPRCQESEAEIARTAREAAASDGPPIQSLEPLYSLADFCYAVRRDVIDTIGDADESYGLGPCWEMDYNVRAARAGFRGVWVRGSFVLRAPFTVRRRVEEARRFDASKHRYQDKFCGARLRGDKTDYRAHCLGDACPDFAPASLIQIRAQRVIAIEAPALAALSPPAAPPTIRLTGAEPLVTCIMPTADRHVFLGQAIRGFLRQDYPNLELLVIDDGANPAVAAIPDDPRIRYERLDRRLTVGAKRNLACDKAHGDFIVHWDDDDWYPPSRVAQQIKALIERPADICGASRLLYYDPSADRAWEYRYTAGSPQWLAGNTLAYRKDAWRGSPFPDVQVGEDALFLWNNTRRTLVDLADLSLCVGMVHSGNTSRKETAGAFWHPIASAAVHALLGDDLHFYRGLPITGDQARWPMVSCIMPTYNRRSVIPLAIQSFLRQDYPHRELVVVDDGEDSVADLVAGSPELRYCRLPPKRTIGSKRNVACDQARGEFIAHWDDDDWYAPERLRYQLAPLISGQADMTGLENKFVLETGQGRFWTTRRDLHQKMFLGDVHGGTLVFRRQLFTDGLRYPDANLAEDAWLLHTALKRGKRLLKLSNPGVFVYVRHGRNAWRECIPGRFLNPDGWETVPRPTMFTATDLSSYERAAASM